MHEDIILLHRLSIVSYNLKLSKENKHFCYFFVILLAHLFGNSYFGTIQMMDLYGYCIPNIMLQSSRAMADSLIILLQNVASYLFWYSASYLIW